MMYITQKGHQDGVNVGGATSPARPYLLPRKKIPARKKDCLKKIVRMQRACSMKTIS